VSGLIGFQLLYPIIKPHRYFGSTKEWILTILIVILVTVYFIFYKRFVSISFDDSTKQIFLTTMTLINGDKTDNYDYSDISINNGKDPASFRKKATEFIEISNKKQKVIKIEKTSIGENSFNKILNEFQQLKILV
jgi:hypothetical protein